MLLLLAQTTEDFASRSSIIEGLIQRISVGDNGAIGELYNLIQTDIFAFALSKVANKSDAEDIMQETFINVYKYSSQYIPKGKPMAWIITIELNIIRRYFQVKKRTVSIEEKTNQPFIDDSFETKVINSAFLKQLINLLTEEEREIIILHVVSGLKHREIATLLNIPLATVLSKYNRALKKLQVVIKEEV